MILANTLFAAAVLAAPAPPAPVAVQEGVTVEWSVPGTFVPGTSFRADVSVEVPEGGGTLPGWALGAAAFSIDGAPLAERPADAAPLSFPTAVSIAVSVEIGPLLADSAGEFEIACDVEGAGGPMAVRRVERAPSELDFMTLPAEELDEYWVLMRTNQGDLLIEFWPQHAPNHVRNFLDLSYTGFYDGVIFHRVIPGFMIQGGDPTGRGNGNGPRTLDAEFSDEVKHVAGVLSMARTGDPNSASCQFFVMHGTAAHLDGQYSAFGQLVSGQEVVDAIVNTPRGAGDRPLEEQKIEWAAVVLPPAK